MLKILIVDDESTARKGMRTCIDWEKHGFTLVGEADNGAAALEMAAKLKPHIILSDICMPVMNGIQLVENLRQILPECRLIIMSGYDEFSYAKSLMELHVAYYLLKPVAEEELLEVLNKLSVEIAEENQQKAGLETSQQLIHESFPQIKSKFMKNILHGSFKSRAERQQWANVLNLKIDANAYQFASVIITFNHNPSDSASLSMEEKETNNSEIVNNAESVLHRFGSGILCYYGFDYFTGLLSIKPGEPNAIDVLKREIGAVLKNLQAKKPVVGIGCLVEDLSDIHLSYHQAITQVNEQQHKGRSAIMQIALTYIEDHLTSEINLAAVAREAYVTPNYLSRIFKEEMDTNFVDWLNHLRIEKAKELLKTTNLKAYEVADQVGYKNYKYFSTLFKKATGVPPKNYICSCVE